MDTKIPAPLEFSGNIAENYKRFKQRVNIYLMANGLNKKSDEVKVAIFLNLIGEEGIDIYNNFGLSEEEKNKYDEVIRKFDEYLLPKKNIIYERFIFYKRTQEPNEPVDNFVKELKKLAKNCEFGDEQDMIRDRLVLGIADLAVQEKLLSITDLKLDKAIEICRAKEMLKERIKTVQEEKAVEKVEKKYMTKTRTKNQKVQKKPEIKEETGSEAFQCKRCNRKHGQRECPAFGRRCNRCRKLNHFEAACRVKEVQEVEDSEDEDNILVESVNIIKGKVHEMRVVVWYENIEVDGKIIKFKLDTGAQVNTLPEKLLDKFKDKRIERTNVILESFGEHKFKPLGD